MNKTPYTSIEALEQLKRVAMEIPPAQLDMGCWAKVEGKDHLVEVDDGAGGKTLVITKGCGSSACLAGWAACDPWFTSRGMHLYVEKPNIKHHAENPQFWYRSIVVKGPGPTDVPKIEDEHGQRDAAFDASAFFGLNSDEEGALFGNNADDAKEIIPLIDAVIAARRKGEHAELEDLQGATHLRF